MPVILEPASEKLRTWLDPGRYEWSKELQAILKPFDGELEVYPVSKEVGKVGNNSPSFIIPVASKENKSNIANFFANSSPKKTAQTSAGDSNAPAPVKTEQQSPTKGTVFSPQKPTPTKGTKREAVDDTADEGQLTKKPHVDDTKTGISASPSKSTRSKTISATKNTTKPLPKKSQDGSQKITNFFSK